jgi:hypothetical protein
MEAPADFTPPAPLDINARLRTAAAGAPTRHLASTSAPAGQLASASTATGELASAGTATNTIHHLSPSGKETLDDRLRLPGQFDARQIKNPSGQIGQNS